MITSDADLLKLRSDILDHGETTWADQLAMAESDVIEYIKTEWFVKAAKSKYGFGMDGFAFQDVVYQFNVSHLNTAALVNLICYRAMGWYIYPSLTRDTDDGADAFTRRADRYRAFYESESEKVEKMALYDFNADSQFDDLERQPTSRTVKVYRA